MAIYYMVEGREFVPGEGKKAKAYAQSLANERGSAVALITEHVYVTRDPSGFVYDSEVYKRSTKLIKPKKTNAGRYSFRKTKKALRKQGYTIKSSKRRKASVRGGKHSTEGSLVPAKLIRKPNGKYAVMVTREAARKLNTGAPPKLYELSRVPINRGGYDRSGSYWGIGAPLYFYDVDDNGNQHDGHLRAHSRADAMEQLKRKFPGLKR